MEASPAVGGNENEVRRGRNLPEDRVGSSRFQISEEDLQRARVYGLLARVLAEPMSDETLATIRALDGESDETELGRAFSAFGAVAARTSRSVAEEEYAVLFHGAGAGGELLPYASHYLTGFLYEKPLADLRGHLAELGVAASGASPEPEDHVAFLCEVMHGLITGAFGEPADLATQKRFFTGHMANWVGTFFEELESSESTALYMPVGTIGKLFVGIEKHAFEMII